MARAKASKYVLKIGDYERHELTLSARDAARAATQIARGTFDPNKSMHEQPDNARPGRAVKLIDDSGAVVMDCRPSIVPRGSRGRVRRTFAKCDISPGFRAKIRKRRSKR